MKKLKEKRFEIDVDVKWTQVVFATSKTKAVKQVIASFDDEYNLQITDEEIKEIREIK